MSKNKRHLIKTCGTLDLTSVKEYENLLAWDFEKAEQTLNRINKVDRQVIAGNWYLLNEQVLLFENQSIFVNGKVTHAKLLKLGDELVGTNGNVVVVNSLKRIIGKHTFYRFEIDGNHSFFVNGFLLHTASRYWVGAGGYWTSAANWSATDGGAGGAGVPTSADNTFFTALSGNCNASNGGDTNNTANVADFDCTGYVGSITSGGRSNTLNCYGSFKLVAGMTFNGAFVAHNFKATATGKTITTAGKTLGAMTFDGIGGGWTLQDALTYANNGNLTLTNGALDLGNQNVTGGFFASSNANTRTLTMGSGTYTLIGNGVNLWDMTTTTNFTFNANTSTIKITSDVGASDRNFIGGGKTYNNFLNAATMTTGSIVITDSNTFADFKIDVGIKTKFTDGTTQTVATLTCAAGTQRTMTGTSTGGWTLSDTTGTNAVNNCTISYSTVLGGATWQAWTSLGNIDGGNNTGWGKDTGWKSPTTTPAPGRLWDFWVWNSSRGNN